jgi:hypothetical protein
MLKNGTSASPAWLCQQRLTASRRAYKQYSSRDASAEALEFLGVLQKLYNFRHFFLGLVYACDVLECYFDPLFVVQPVFTPAKRHQHTASAAAKVPREHKI